MPKNNITPALTLQKYLNDFIPDKNQRAKMTTLVIKDKQLLQSDTDLSDFVNLVNITITGNQLTDIHFLNSIKNKEKISSLFFSENKIEDPDFEFLGNNFPNLTWVLGTLSERTVYQDMDYLPDLLDSSIQDIHNRTVGRYNLSQQGTLAQLRKESIQRRQKEVAKRDLDKVLGQGTVKKFVEENSRIQEIKTKNPIQIQVIESLDDFSVEGSSGGIFVFSIFGSDDKDIESEIKNVFNKHLKNRGLVWQNETDFNLLNRSSETIEENVRERLFNNIQKFLIDQTRKQLRGLPTNRLNNTASGSRDSKDQSGKSQGLDSNDRSKLDQVLPGLFTNGKLDENKLNEIEKIKELFQKTEINPADTNALQQ
ncbi:6283_t:CDS:2, partial [Funneliformis geosporum]